MTMVMQKFTALALEKFAECGMLAEVVESSARRSLTIFARLDLGEHKVPLSFFRPDWTVEPTPWFNKWWAKLLRRADRGLRRLGHRFPSLDMRLTKFLAFGLRLPYWLDALVHAQNIRASYKKESLPVDALERIAAMANYLQHRQGVQPMQVLVGRKAMLDLRRSLFCADYWPDMIAHFENPFADQVLGLAVQISPFLAEDEILVV